MGGIVVEAYVNKDKKNMRYSLMLGKEKGKVYVESAGAPNYDYLESGDELK
jgi:hypothetical protein